MAEPYWNRHRRRHQERVMGDDWLEMALAAIRKEIDRSRAVAISAERERCAKACEEAADEYHDLGRRNSERAALECAAAIRKGE
jgi:hypothetical protein